MKRHVLYAGILFLGLTIHAGYAADEWVGKAIAGYELTDQHGNPHHLEEGTKTVVLCFEMKLAKSLHKWLAEQGPDYLPTHQTEYVADISGMPRIITKLFAGPKMRRYPFRILWARDDAFAAQYPAEDKKITVIQLDDKQVITAVTYAATPLEIMAVIDPEGFEKTKISDDR